jgi:hypothetical protein
VVVEVVCWGATGANKDMAEGLGVFELNTEFVNDGAALMVAGASGSVSEAGLGVLEPNMEKEGGGLTVAGASGSV